MVIQVSSKQQIPCSRAACQANDGYRKNDAVCELKADWAFCAETLAFPSDGPVLVQFAGFAVVRDPSLSSTMQLGTVAWMSWCLLSS